VEANLGQARLLALPRARTHVSCNPLPDTWPAFYERNQLQKRKSRSRCFKPAEKEDGACKRYRIRTTVGVKRERRTSCSSDVHAALATSRLKGSRTCEPHMCGRTFGFMHEWTQKQDDRGHASLHGARSDAWGPYPHQRDAVQGGWGPKWEDGPTVAWNGVTRQPPRQPQPKR
jgi:hypothetical protein